MLAVRDVPKILRGGAVAGATIGNPSRKRNHGSQHVWGLNSEETRYSQGV